MKIRKQWFLVWALLGAVSGELLQVLDFQQDGLPRSETEAVYKGTISRDRKIKSMTFCMRFKLRCIHASATILKLADTTEKDDEKLIGIIWITKIRTMMAGLRRFQELKKEFEVDRWHHLCFFYDDESHVIGSYVDGELNHNETYYTPGYAYGDYVILGQGAKVGIDETSFCGEMTQVNVWDKVLSEQEIIDIAQCHSNKEGNYIAWGAGWTLYNIKEYTIELKNICGSTANMYKWFNSKSRDEAHYICNALGGVLPEVSGMPEVDFWHNLAKTNWPQEPGCHTKFWTGLMDEEVDGVWKKAVDGNMGTNIFWAPGEPDGLHYQNCALIYDLGMRDVTCSVTFQCAICIFQESLIYSFLGTCETDLRHVYFNAYQTNTTELEFRGYGGYEITRKDGKWTWLLRTTNTTFAVLDKYEPYFPLGRRVWILQNSVCGQDTGERKLLFTPCQKGQYTCDNAFCISIDERCDMKYDCLDHSDEVDCSIISLPEGYQEDLPPRTSGKHNFALPVVLNFTVDSLEVDTMEMAMVVSYELSMTWYDNRLSFRNLKKRTSLNLIPFSEVKRMWYPSVSFVNTEGNQATAIDEEAQIYIVRNVDSELYDITVPAEKLIFFGKDNKIVTSRKYATTYTCDFDLLLYPFDEQHCDLHIQMLSASIEYLVVDANNSRVDFMGNPLLLEYEMEKLYILRGKNNEFSDIRVRVPLKRRFGYAILNIYVPSLILLTISYVTLFFRPHIFEVRVTSVLTVLLVTATLFTQVSSTLPKTSYFKMVDIWLLCCIIMNFLIILFHAAIDIVIYDERKGIISPVGVKSAWKRGQEAMHKNGLFYERGFNIPLKPLIIISRVAILAVFFVFSVFYWGFILTS